MTEAVVVVDGAVVSAEAGRTDARVAVVAVHAGGAVAARIELFGAELDLLVAQRSCARKSPTK